MEMEYRPPPPVEVTDLASGLKALVDTPRLLSVRLQEQRQQARRVGAHPDILEFERRFIRRLQHRHGIPMYGHNMVRSKMEQAALYVQGVTKAQYGESPHNWGCAVDIVHSVFAWDLQEQSWAMLGHIGKEVAKQAGIKVVWGGDWSFYDPAHWELSNWREIRGDFPEWPHTRKWVGGQRVPLPKEAAGH
jgi:hypothetical protein